MRNWALVVTLLVVSTFALAQTTGSVSTKGGQEESGSQSSWHDAGPNDRIDRGLANRRAVTIDD